MLTGIVRVACTSFGSESEASSASSKRRPTLGASDVLAKDEQTSGVSTKPSESHKAIVENTEAVLESLLGCPAIADATPDNIPCLS